MAASSNNSIKKILIVAFALCIVCSVVVSTAAVALRPQQQANQEIDRKTNILRVAGVLDRNEDIDTQFAAFTPRVVELETGEYSDQFDPETYDGFAYRRDPAVSRTLSGERDIAGLTRREDYATVYLLGDPDDPEQIILPIRGQGLWGLMRGFLSLEGDGNTIVGITYYEHGETPGLGGEVDNPRWQAQWPGKVVFSDEDSVTPDIRLVKGAATGESEVDALSGATLTSNGVTNMLQFWLSPEGFGEYLARFRDQVDPEDAAEATPDFDVEGA
ncbi:MULTISPECIES: Na(+)-translocating NADH-quinone reductase subunit C [Halomonadaceae]|uniref:Na(+)-translocating NADH-quinone reductase subunit C n=1 Tax=Halomonadaceae TaxID=28256 RepID=UPI0015999506|nr:MULTISPECIES: Na(+)-translocating NADH-quinone reductase subunit C [Halomonas]QJQ94124.1 Na(+)-translocating NADH-quinone reductase subunit C [Halomonas sp. PA5]